MESEFATLPDTLAIEVSTKESTQCVKSGSLHRSLDTNSGMACAAIRYVDLINRIANEVPLMVLTGSVTDGLQLMWKAGSVNPRLILVSAIDVRDERKIPAHYNEEDIKISRYGREKIGSHFSGRLSVRGDTAPRTHLKPDVSREDVAHALAYLSQRDDAAGLAIDFVGGETPIEEGLDTVIKRGESNFPL
ncbi:hypothetical protein BDV98DRAFT_608500 [Pterulicium gracile]|uniref:Uncharacterized protein n=1 Tax=Pterulicium gracile TaxID=1884261 RepID=A0A5C3Q3P5_9AGAR|nr:hypothetical protein BDV98DRAFT_608500 [Pterula gracilis]